MNLYKLHMHISMTDHEVSNGYSMSVGEPCTLKTCTTFMKSPEHPYISSNKKPLYPYK